MVACARVELEGIALPRVDGDGEVLRAETHVVCRDADRGTGAPRVFGTARRSLHGPDRREDDLGAVLSSAVEDEVDRAAPLDAGCAPAPLRAALGARAGVGAMAVTEAVRGQRSWALSTRAPEASGSEIKKRSFESGSGLTATANVAARSADVMSSSPRATAGLGLRGRARWA